MNINVLELSIIQVYTPTEESSDEELKFFYSTVDKALQLSENNVIVMGDFNATTLIPIKLPQRFADDIVLLSESTNELQVMINTLHEKSRRVGLIINLTKTKIMTNHTKRPIYLENSLLTYVDADIYLGKQVSFNQKNHELEVERRINITSKVLESQRNTQKQYDDTDEN
ncbi:uncharacterized protein LOC123668855 [Melitaea cinxia]|uniref:uncharacterized protein LOC123668855 n=1 Tax=Melitaea cinxia TaxID=113334 RepID=UPI001E271E52|nr:uncharacterized protein LOC123668855 [Melitaea cinxia]